MFKDLLAIRDSIGSIKSLEWVLLWVGARDRNGSVPLGATDNRKFRKLLVVASLR